MPEETLSALEATLILPPPSLPSTLYQIHRLTTITTETGLAAAQSLYSQISSLPAHGHRARRLPVHRATMHSTALQNLHSARDDSLRLLYTIMNSANTRLRLGNADIETMETFAKKAMYFAWQTIFTVLGMVDDLISKVKWGVRELRLLREVAGRLVRRVKGVVRGHLGRIKRVFDKAVRDFEARCGVDVGVGVGLGELRVERSELRSLARELCLGTGGLSV
ncbi:hypothetical protein BJY04DRAFT_224085 [Aspergillus karnatakaensis]|uniref:uncharacterized protein n=1 Tax=Aspergillus karnatakaensis TaxID=1810916 RepID=UPI003CCCF5A3